MIDALESEGIFITTKISNEESGKPKPLVLRRDFPADTILRDGTFNVMTAIPIEELPNINVGDAVVDAFMKIVPTLSIWPYRLNCEEAFELRLNSFDIF